MTFIAATNYKIIFEGIRGASYQGDIAIDDVVLLDNVCPPPGDSNFETGMGTWVNVPKGDDFDWLRGTGSTSSFNTGPHIDHTTNSTKGRWQISIIIEQTIHSCFLTCVALLQWQICSTVGVLSYNNGTSI